MQISIIIPAVVQAPSLLKQFQDNLKTFQHDSVERIIVICNRLTLMTASSLELILGADIGAPVSVVHDKERSVAGAWNRGIELSLEAGLSTFLITAVDVAFKSDTIERMVRFGQQYPEVPLWCSSANRDNPDARLPTRDFHDFSCFMLRQSTIAAHGWFDREFKPAYFEDNDYVTRLVLAGAWPKQLTDARHLHQASATIRLDAEMARHVKNHFNANSRRFHCKWRCKENNFRRVATECFATPFDTGKPLQWWPEQDRVDYHCAGGINE